MQRHRGVAALIAAACLLLTSCAHQSGANAAPPNQYGTGTSSNSSSDSSSTGPTVTAACPVLSVSDIVRIVGDGGSSGPIKAFEQKPDYETGASIYQCDYGTSSDDSQFSLVVCSSIVPGYAPSKMVTSFGTKLKTTGTRRPVPNLGDAATFFQPDAQYTMLAFAKHSGDKLLGAAFVAPSTVPETKLVQLMTLAANRL